MLHPDPDAPDTPRSVLMTLLACVLVVGGFVLLYTDHERAMIAMPEPEHPPTVNDGGERAPLFPSGVAVLRAEDAYR